ESVPVPFRKIRLRFEIESDADAKQLETLKELTERYCVIFQTLKNPPAFDVRFATAAPKGAKKRT
ncbi:MAG TPA: OsmC family protein, partial [Dongiaceae bacterium]